MSRTIDTNVLLYASNTDATQHARAAELIAGILTGPELTTILWPVLHSYLRIATHSGIFVNPLTIDQANSAVEALLASSAVNVVGAGDRFWQCYTSLGGARGNDVPDAVIVALMIEYGVTTILTNDRDFRRYPEVRVRNPFAD